MVPEIWSTADRIFCYSGPFLLFYSPIDPENRNLEKKKKIPDDIIILQTQMTVIWCMVPEIWSATDRIVYHFGLFFTLLPLNNPKNQNFEKMKKNAKRYYHFKHVYHKWQPWSMFLKILSATDRIFCHFGLFFALLPP